MLIGVVALDQITKLLVAHNMQLHESIELIPGVLRFTYITNPAAAMGLFANARWLFMILSPVAVIAIEVYLMCARNVGRMYTVALSMIAGGGIGNMIDRMFYGEALGHGEVIDFIDFCAFPQIWNYIFNVADSFVCVGAGIMLLAIIIDMVKEFRADKNKRVDAVNVGDQSENDESDPNNHE